MGRVAKINTLDLYNYLVEHIDADRKLLIGKKQIAEHFNVELYVINNHFAILEKSGVVVSVKNALARNNKDYFVLSWNDDKKPVSGVNYLDPHRTIKQVYDDLLHIMDYFYCEKNKLLRVDDYGVTYTGLDKTSEHLVYIEISGLLDFLEEQITAHEKQKLSLKGDDNYARY